MKKGYLSEYFRGVAAKRLTAVEADESRSNGHEYNTTRSMLDFLGRPERSTELPTRFIYLTDDDAEPLVEDAYLTLYDSRRNQPRRAAEYRLYFPTTNVSLNASEGDLLIIAQRQDEEAALLAIIAEDGSSIANQLQWLFGLSEHEHPGFSVKAELETEQDRIEFASRFILESIGIIVETSEESLLDGMLLRFAGRFPTTREFSQYARESMSDVDVMLSPDDALMAWMEREEILFRTFERYLIAERLSEGFGSDAFEDQGVNVEAFLKYSLSVQNRRKSRVGLALENHLEVIFSRCQITHSRTQVTENKNKPDFLFPSIDAYHNPDCDQRLLSMLAAKSTCKDRWRQILSEADRIKQKHLLTLEAGISIGQTDEMEAQGVQLVVPSKLHGTYRPQQQNWLFSLNDFIGLARARQEAVTEILGM